jgi:hypothetical protein
MNAQHYAQGQNGWTKTKVQKNQEKYECVHARDGYMVTCDEGPYVPYSG